MINLLLAVLFLQSIVSLSGCAKKLESEGPEGPAGPTGAQGTPGANGVNPSPITPIKLCSNAPAPNYPSTFPEYALCINGNLYGVYNNGVNPLAFLALLPPGRYESLATGAQCTLTITENCQVTQD